MPRALPRGAQAIMSLAAVRLRPERPDWHRCDRSEPCVDTPMEDGGERTAQSQYLVSPGTRSRPYAAPPAMVRPSVEPGTARCRSVSIASMPTAEAIARSSGSALVGVGCGELTVRGPVGFPPSKWSSTRPGSRSLRRYTRLPGVVGGSIARAPANSSALSATAPRAWRPPDVHDRRRPAYSPLSGLRTPYSTSRTATTRARGSRAGNGVVRRV